MILNKQGYIRTLEDLEYVLKDNHTLWDAIPIKIKNGLSNDVQVIVKLLSYCLSKQLITIDYLSNLLDFDTCDLELCYAYAELFDIPLPRFPLVSTIRTNYVESTLVKTIQDLSIDHNFYTTDFVHQCDLSAVTLTAPYLPTTLTCTNVDINNITFTNPNYGISTLNYKILFSYHRDYTKQIRLICKNILHIHNARTTLLGIKLYLYYLLCDDDSSIVMNSFPRQYPIFKFPSIRGSIGTTLQTPYVGRTYPTYNYQDAMFHRGINNLGSTPQASWFRLPFPLANIYNNYQGQSSISISGPPALPPFYGPQVINTGISDYSLTPRFIDHSGGGQSPYNYFLQITITCDLIQQLEDFIKDTIINKFIMFTDLYNNISFTFINNKTRW